MDDGIPEPIGYIPEEKWQAGLDKAFLDVFSDVGSIESREREGERERESHGRRNRAIRIERRQQFGLGNMQ